MFESRILKSPILFDRMYVSRWVGWLPMFQFQWTECLCYESILLIWLEGSLTHLYWLILHWNRTEQNRTELKYNTMTYSLFSFFDFLVFVSKFIQTNHWNSGGCADAVRRILTKMDGKHLLCTMMKYGSCTLVRSDERITIVLPTCMKCHVMTIPNSLLVHQS